MVINARPTNSILEHLELNCALSPRIEVELSEIGEVASPAHFSHLRNMQLHIGLSDVKECFHRLRQPR